MPEEYTLIATSFIPNEATASGLASDFVRWNMRRPGMVALYAVLSLIALASLVSAAITRDPSAAISFVLWVGLGVLIPSMAYRSARHGMARIYSPGSLVTLRIDDDGITRTTALGSQTTRFVALRSVVETEHAVLVRPHGTRGVFVVPRALFGPGDVERMRAGIAATPQAARRR